MMQQMIFVNNFIKLRMNLKDYKMCRSKKFPLPKPNAEKKLHRVDTIALISHEQPASYEIHADIDSSSVIMFNEHEYIKRQFTHIVKVEASVEEGVVKIDDSLCQQILPIINHNLAENKNNLIIIPVLDPEPINKLLIQKNNKEKLQIQADSPSKQQPANILEETITSFLTNKMANTVVSLSIMSVSANGALSDELNYDWLEENKEIGPEALKLKAPLKITNNRDKEVKAFDLNRQQINNWTEAKQILSHYNQISNYIEYWSMFEDGCADCNKNGELYQISEVQVDPEYGSIQKVIKKCRILKINQFMKTSNLMMMRVSQAVHEYVTSTESKNTRDYPLMMLLNECFNSRNKWKLTVFTQLGTNYGLKEENVCLSMNLQIPARFSHYKNYCDNDQIIGQVKKYAVNFCPTTVNDRQTAMSTQKIRSNKKALKLLAESERVTSKSYYYDTFSSNEKRKVFQALLKEQEIDLEKEKPGDELAKAYRNLTSLQARTRLAAPVRNPNFY